MADTEDDGHVYMVWMFVQSMNTLKKFIRIQSLTEDCNYPEFPDSSNGRFPSGYT